MNESIRNRLPKHENATRFWWIRHAYVPEVKERMYGSLDVDCDTSDKTLFSQVAAKLPNQALWVTSPLKRAKQTASALCAAGIQYREMTQDPDILEQDFGDYNGMSHVELFALRNDAYLGFWPLPPEQQAPNGESFAMLRTRVENFISRMTEQHRGEDIICVAHRGSILAALQVALNLPLRNTVSFDIGNVSVTRLTYHADVPSAGPQWRVADVSWLP
ncbi:MAG: histidine phosphatase family protein [Granulosicoccus sp.]|nr:histidine phosphatase family protein [Granulosicoccus sp.]